MMLQLHVHDAGLCWIIINLQTIRHKLFQVTTSRTVSSFFFQRLFPAILSRFILHFPENLQFGENFNAPDKWWALYHLSSVSCPVLTRGTSPCRPRTARPGVVIYGSRERDIIGRVIHQLLDRRTNFSFLLTGKFSDELWRWTHRVRIMVVKMNGFSFLGKKLF